MADSAEQFIAGRWVAGGGRLFESRNPADGSMLWHGNAADPGQVSAAAAAARDAFPAWRDRGVNQRAEFLAGFAELLETQRPALAATISAETGKPRWEALAEVTAMKAKFALAHKAYHARRSENVQALPDSRGFTRFRPHGAVAVFGPFNMPGHLPNGHIMPALLAGNTVVFKPSEYTPLVGQMITQLWAQAKLPPGVFNLVQGGGRVGAALAAESRLDGLFFTGSFATGMALARACLEFPQRMLVLEMGGNNPLVIWDSGDVQAAAITAIVSAFITSGQRCSCARRLIVSSGPAGEALVRELVHTTAQIRVGPSTLVPEPFMGPLISATAAQRVLQAQADLLAHGGLPLLPARAMPESPALLSPGIIDVTAINSRRDEEIFGPLLQLIRVPSFEAAIAEANHTRYGLSAALLTDDASLYEKFRMHIKAGVINWNRPTTGASSELPFGGAGYSGNHRPAGYYSADYCDYPVASMEAPALTLAAVPPGIMP